MWVLRPGPLQADAETPLAARKPPRLPGADFKKLVLKILVQRNTPVPFCNFLFYPSVSTFSLLLYCLMCHVTVLMSYF